MDENYVYTDDARRYIMSSRENLTEKLAASFAMYFSVFIIAGIAAYLFFGSFKNTDFGVFTLTKPALASGFAGFMNYIINAASVSAMLVLAIYMAAFTVLCRPIAAAAVIRRGLCLGSAVSFTVNGRISCATSPLMLYFASTLAIILLASYSELYSKCMCRSYSCRNLRVGTSVAAEYTRLTAVLSGIIFICDFIRVSAV